MSAGPVRVITVSREYGSGGAAVARRVAERLGWRLLDRALVEQTARHAHCDPAVVAPLDEHVDPWIHRLGRSLWHGGFEGVAAVDETSLVDAERMAAITARVIEEAAAIGSCVMVGRGAQCVLRGRPDAFHVFVYAPRAARLERLAGRLAAGADLVAALDSTDRERAAYLKRHFGRAWDDRDLYHLMVSSGPGPEAAVTIILGAVAALGTAP